MRLIFTALIWVMILSFSANSQPQPPDTLWTNTYGRSSSEYSYCVQQTSDGGYVVTGQTYEYGDWNAYLLKTDPDGNIIWTRVYTEPGLNYARCVQQTSDGGYIITGYTTSCSTCSGGMFLIKTDSQGNIEWYRDYTRYNPPYYSHDEGWWVEQTADGGYIVSGCWNNWWVCLVKIGQEGEVLWNHTYENGIGYSVRQTTDGGYIVAGSYSSALLTRVDEEGNLIWTRTFGGNSSKGYSVQETSDLGYIIAGYEYYSYTNHDVLLVKTDMHGDEIWARTYGGNSSEDGWSVQQTSDGGYIITGYTNSFGAGEYDVYVIKTDSNGDTTWTQTFGGSEFDKGYSVQQTRDGGYIIGGYTASFGAGSSDVYLIRLDREGDLEEDFSWEKPGEFTLHPACPNPFNPETNLRFTLLKAGDITLSVYDINGREIARLLNEWQPAGMGEVVFDGSKLSSGVYFIHLEGNGLVQTQKVLLVK
ncbi:MAG: T9SS type A sorting domain-containing protein [candidate division Zixibacteria bacterium]|nr:T9SS type A sorting domain-containing protein [Candidatus Tariuqbacter arcticus]